MFYSCHKKILKSLPFCKGTCRQAIEVHIVHEEFVEEREKQGVRAQMKTLQQAGVTLACRLGNEGSHE